MSFVLAALLVSMSTAQIPAPPPGVAPSGGTVLTLNSALDEAKEHSQDLKQLQARLDQSWQISKKAWAAYLPQISVGGSYTRNNVAADFTIPSSYYIRDVGVPQGPPFDPSQPPGIGNPPGAPTTLTQIPATLQAITIQKEHQWGATAQLSQALIVPPLWAAIHGSYVAQRAAALNIDNARRETLFAVAQLYYGAVALKQATEVQANIMAINKERVRDAQVRFNAGAVNKVTLLRAQIDLAQAEQDFRRASFSYAGAKSSLAALLDRQPDFEVVEPPEPEQIAGSPDELIAAAPRERPDVLAAKELVGVAEDNHRVSWLGYFPAISLTARYQLANVTGFTGRPDNWAIVIGASWTLFDGGLREANLQDNAAKIVEARASERAAENRVQDEVRQALYALESARANRVKGEEQVRLAKETLALVKLNSNAGAATYLEVSDATSNLLQAELTVLVENLNAQLSVLKLARAAGRWKP